MCEVRTPSAAEFENPPNNMVMVLQVVIHGYHQ